MLRFAKGIEEVKRDTEVGDQETNLAKTGTKYTPEFAKEQLPVFFFEFFLLLVLAGNRQTVLCLFFQLLTNSFCYILPWLRKD